MATWNVIWKRYLYSETFELNVAAETFEAAVKLAKATLRKRGKKRVELLSVKRTATLDA